MSNTAEAYKKLIIETHERDGDFVMLEDGFVYFWAGGAINSSALRILADELDRRNEAWNQQILAYFASKKEPT